MTTILPDLPALVKSAGPLTSNTLNKSKIYREYEESSYSYLSLPERQYYLDLVRFALARNTQSYYSYLGGEADINDNICEFFSDLCLDITEKWKEVYQKFGVSVPELDIPNFTNDDFVQTLCYVYITDDDNWYAAMQYDQSAEDIPITTDKIKMEKLIDDSFVTECIINALLSSLAYPPSPRRPLNEGEVMNYIASLS